jgi:ABC-type amino acid transport substrate-binding protein
MIKRPAITAKFTERFSPRVWLAIAWVLFITQIFTVSAEPQTLTIGTQERLLASIAPEMALSLQETAAAIGITIEFINLPNKRSLLMAAQGDVDGDFFRHPVIESSFPTLRRVDVPLAHFDYQVWVHNDQTCMSDLSALSQLKPIGVRGVKYFESHVFPLSQVGYEEVEEFTQAFRMLSLGRADYTVQDKSVIELFSQQTKIQLKPCLNEPLFSMPLYLYLHESHQNLIATLEQALIKALKAKGLAALPHLKIGTRSVVLNQIAVNSSRLVQRAGQRIGFNIDYVELPLKRSLHIADLGELDGEFHRHTVIEARHPTLLRVDVPLYYYDYWVWVPQTSTCMTDRQALQQLKPIGVSGIEFYQKYVYPYSQVGHEEASSLELAIKMLQRGRADYLVQGHAIIESLRKDTGIILQPCLSKPYLSLPFYLYLHESNSALIPNFERALKAVMAEQSPPQILD